MLVFALRNPSLSQRTVHGPLLFFGFSARNAAVNFPSLTTWDQSSLFVFLLSRCQRTAAKPSWDTPPHRGIALDRGTCLS